MLLFIPYCLANQYSLFLLFREHDFGPVGRPVMAGHDCGGKDKVKAGHAPTSLRPILGQCDTMVLRIA